MLTDREIGSQLWGPQSGGSENVGPVLHNMLAKAESDAEFWKIFQLGWSSIDDSWSWRTDFTRLLDERRSAVPFLEGRDKDFYDSLPGAIPVYRGCSLERKRGLAWTTDCDIAAEFARGHRQIKVPNAVVVSARIPKAGVYSVSTNRSESEIILNWRRLRNVSHELMTEPV